MRHFFFDVVAKSSRSYDYHGQTLSTSTEARDVAETLALDLACSESDDWAGAEIQVRNETGEKLYSVSVLSSDAIFA
jgi:hypothetical protein